MDTFRFRVVMTVDVEAFDESDALDALREEFGVGSDGPSTQVVECEYSPIGEKKHK